MRIKFTNILLAIPFVFMLTLPPIISAQCCFVPIQFNPNQFNPTLFNPRNLTSRNCKMITEPLKKNKLNKAIKNDTMFDIILTCNANNTICSKVKVAFDTAAQIISSTFILNNRISLNASYISFCNGVPNCPNSNVLGMFKQAMLL